MAIPKKIIDLTTLALQDRVLTYKERETIVTEALNMGVSQMEIDLYLTNALNKRLQSYTKEELGSCPGCGHGVPLIADECPYCGTLLQHIENHTVPPIHPDSFNVSGRAAKIIRQENYNTDQERKTNCPKCGAPYPLVSNICSHCGYVLHEQRDSDFNIKNLIDNINNSISDLERCPNPTLGQIFGYNVNLLLISLCFVCCFLSGYDASGYIGFAAICFIVFIVTTRNKFKKVSPVTTADEMFYDALNYHAMYSRQVDTLYGNNQEAKNLLDKYQGVINGLEQQRKTTRNNQFISLACFVLSPLILVLLHFLFAPSPKDAYQKAMTQYPEIFEVSAIQKSLHPYPVKMGVHPDLQEYMRATDDVNLTFDVVDDMKVGYTMRINNVKISSTGKEFNGMDTCRFSVVLWDGNEEAYQYPFQVFDYYVDRSSQKRDYYTGRFVRNMLKQGKGDIYVDFICLDTIRTNALPKIIADSTCYYTIYTKKR